MGYFSNRVIGIIQDVFFGRGWVLLRSGSGYNILLDAKMRGISDCPMKIFIAVLEYVPGVPRFVYTSGDVHTAPFTRTSRAYFISTILTGHGVQIVFFHKLSSTFLNPWARGMLRESF